MESDKIVVKKISNAEYKLKTITCFHINPAFLRGDIYDTLLHRGILTSVLYTNGIDEKLNPYIKIYTHGNLHEEITIYP